MPHTLEGHLVTTTALRMRVWTSKILERQLDIIISIVIVTVICYLL